jgi:hypothetical protein
MLGGLSTSAYCAVFGTLYATLFGVGLGQPLSILLALSASYLASVLLVPPTITPTHPQRGPARMMPRSTASHREFITAGLGAWLPDALVVGEVHQQEALASARGG